MNKNVKNKKHLNYFTSKKMVVIKKSKITLHNSYKMLKMRAEAIAKLSKNLSYEKIVDSIAEKNTKYF
ncbi:hypothetical protein [Acetobacterium wieringae]|uniref:hypothetical protein n=1 Tax=Acetobacterium wieringae TaxID=52694 RepID=UPI0031582EC2